MRRAGGHINMAKFTDVFWTTAKVLLALLIISIAGWVAVGVFGGLGSAVMPSAKPTSVSLRNSDDDVTDAVRTSMPKSAWDRGMARAASHHCYTNGMSKDEVLRALGEPSERKDYGGEIGSNWTWQLPAGKCLKYDGDNCIQHEENHQIIFFTSGGNAKGAAGCETLAGKYVYFANSELFRPAAKAQDAVPCPSSICAEEWPNGVRPR
jgi:hypothetical protein